MLSTRPWLLCSTTLALLILSSCCTAHLPVDIKDEELYYIKGLPTSQPNDSTYAVQMWFLSSGVNDLTKAQWDAISQGMVALSLQSWDNVNGYIAKLCSKPAICNYEAQKKLAALTQRLHFAAGVVDLP